MLHVDCGDHHPFISEQSIQVKGGEFVLFRSNTDYSCSKMNA